MESRHRYIPVDWFESYMDEFFCLFYLQDIDSLRTARLRTIHTMLLDHLDKEETPPEDYKSFSPARANLLVVILWLLGLEEEALEEAESALHAHPTSISARSNMAYILWMSDEKYKSYEILKGLKYCKTNNPKKWKHLLTTAEAQTAYCYTKLGSSYMSHAIKHFEKVIEERPLEDVWKYTLALNLRQLERERYLTQRLGITVSQAQSKVFDLLVKVKDNKGNSKELRALAAAELGQMLNFPKEENVPVLKNKAEKLRLNAEKCYKYCLEVNGENTSILCRAGIFYRYSGDLEQSRIVLEKAVRLKPTPTSHFQLGLTYKKMAAKMKANNQTFTTFHRPQTGNYKEEQIRRPGTKLKTLDLTERLMKSPEHEQFFRHDPFVAETLEQFQTALKLSNGEDLFVAYDLGLMYKSLSEYHSALDTFQRIIQVEEDYFKAFEQSALVYQEMRKSASEVQRSNQFMEMAHSMLRMAIVCQCRLFENYRKNHFYNKWIWQSFGTIGEYYKKSRLVNVVVQEEWLLKLIKRYDNDLMVLKDIVTYEMHKEDAHNSKELKAKIEGYVTRKQFEDGVVFLCLLKLTDQRKWLSVWKDLDLEFKVFVHGARGILLRNATPCDSHTMSLNSLAAKRIFRLTYENRSDVMFEYLNRSVIPQIMIVYDLSDESAGKNATVVQCLLSKICGLRTTCLQNYDPNLHDQGKNKACQLLHIVNKGDVSPEFRRRLERSVKIKQRRNNVKGRSSWLNTYHHRRVLTLSLGSARIPDPLQEYPSLLWEPERLEACSNPQSVSRDAVNAICELFCFLLGITIKLDE